MPTRVRVPRAGQQIRLSPQVNTIASHPHALRVVDAGEGCCFDMALPVAPINGGADAAISTGGFGLGDVNFSVMVRWIRGTLSMDSIESSVSSDDEDRCCIGGMAAPT